MAEVTPERTPMKQAVALLVAFVVTFVAAGIATVATATSVDGWYEGLAKPSWTPPTSLFGPVWTALYVLMAFAVWQVWRVGNRESIRGPLFVYGIQLALNALWSLLFFGLDRVGLALIEIVVLLGTIVWTILEFDRVDRRAALLLVPYLAWVAFAAALNGAVWWLNH